MRTVYFTEGYLAGQTRDVAGHVIGFIRDTKGYRWHYLLEGLHMKLHWEGTVEEYIKQGIKHKVAEWITTPKVEYVENI